MSESPHIAEAVAQLKEAAGAKKCWPCGCLHSSLAAIERALPGDERPAEMNAALRAGRERLAAVMYECLGCQVCFPAIALNALHKAGVEVEPESCPTTPAEARGGWPPLPGSYIVRRYHAPLAVCTLTDDGLAEAVDRNAGPEVAIVGTLQTENLGIERLIVNVLANPNIRFILVCGEDSRQAIGHLPGQSLVTLARSGLDDRSRIIGAGGKRPVIRNVARERLSTSGRRSRLSTWSGWRTCLRCFTRRATAPPGTRARQSRSRGSACCSRSRATSPTAWCPTPRATSWSTSTACAGCSRWSTTARTACWTR
jgi:Tetrahydromethanopterin S-methyltransferase, subunit A